MYQRLLSKAEVAQELGISIPTLDRWARLGLGPAPCHLGHSVVYSEQSVMAWIDKQIMEGEKVHALKYQTWIRQAAQ